MGFPVAALERFLLCWASHPSLASCLQTCRAEFRLLNGAEECLSGRGRGLLTLPKIFSENSSYSVMFCSSLRSSVTPLLNKCVELWCVQRKLENEPHCSYLHRHLCGWDRVNGLFGNSKGNPLEPNSSTRANFHQLCK